MKNILNLNLSKIGRFINSFINKKPNRQGTCKPEQCSSIDGKKGNACCRLDYKCFALSNDNCKIYNIRPRNCRSFPANPQDLKLVRNCSYFWK